MKTLGYDLLDELEAMPANAAQKVIDETDPATSVDAWYNEIEYQGCTHVFCVYIDSRCVSDVTEACEMLTTIAERFFPVVTCVQAVRLKRESYAVSRPDFWPKEVLDETIGLIQQEHTTDIVFKIPLKMGAKELLETHRSINRYIRNIFNFISATYGYCYYLTDYCHTLVDDYRNVEASRKASMWCHVVNSGPTKVSVASKLYRFKHHPEKNKNWGRDTMETLRCVREIISHPVITDNLINEVLINWVWQYAHRGKYKDSGVIIDPSEFF